MIENYQPEELMQAISQHSRAYAEICNLITLAEWHRKNCRENCDVSLYLVKCTVDRLFKHCYDNEKQDIILKVTSIKWS